MPRTGRIAGGLVLVALVAGGSWWALARGGAPAAGPAAPGGVIAQSPEPGASKPAEDATLVAPEHAAGRESAPAAPAPAFALVRVQVVDAASGAPLPDLVVRATTEDGGENGFAEDAGRSRGGPWEELHTDAGGRVVVEAPPEKELTLFCPGKRGETGSARESVPPLAAGATRAVVLALASGDDLVAWLKVVEEATGAPLAGVRIVGSVADADPRTDAQGLARVVARTWQPTDLRIEVEGRCETYLLPEKGHERAEDAMVVPLPASASLVVHVTDAAGQPVADAAVRLSTAQYNLVHPRSARSRSGVRMGNRTWDGQTDAAGTATISALPPRVGIDAELTAPRPWHPPERIALGPGEERSVDWRLTDGCLVHGRLVDQDEAPVPARDVTLVAANRRRASYIPAYHFGNASFGTTTDADGRFRIEGVPSGDWLIGPTPRDHAQAPDPDGVAPLGRYLAIEDGRAEVELTLRVDRGLFIRGRVLDAEGEPGTGCLVHAFDRQTQLSAFTTTDREDGSFTLGPLMAGRYLVHASGRSIAGRDADGDSAPVEVEAGTPDVVLRLQPGARLAGRLVDADGAPIAQRAELWLASLESRTYGIHGVSCKEDGTFGIGGIGAGRYELGANLPDGRVGRLAGIEVSAGESQEDLVVPMAVGGHVRVRHDGPERYANIEVLQDGVIVDLDGVERGTSREFASPSGRVTVRAEYHDDDPRTVERTVVVGPGETVDVHFEEGAR